MLYRSLLLSVSALGLLGTATGCTGLTRPDEIAISAEPVAEAQPAKQGAAPTPAPRQPSPEQPAQPAQPANCGE